MSEPDVVDRKTDPPAPPGERPRKATDSGRSTAKLKPEQYELKVRWEKARAVIQLSPTGVKFDFDTSLKVGTKYPVKLSAPGVSFSSTLEVTRCLTMLAGGGRFFRIDGRFFPYVE